MINHKNKFIFIHIPKTGGRSIQHTLLKKFNHDNNIHNIVHNPHISLKDYKEYIGDKIYKYYTFAFVRNSYEKLVSEYFYCIRMNLINTSEFSSFKKFLMKGGMSYSYEHHSKLQLDFIKDENIKISFIGNFKNINSDFQKICRNINAPSLPLLHKNKSTHCCYTKYYDNDCIDYVNDLYHKDIDFFGFNFGE